MSFFAHPTAIIDDGCQVGNDTKIWHFSHLMTGCVIGDNCTIGQNVFIAAKVSLGNNVKVQNNVSLYEGVICEADVFIGPSVQQIFPDYNIKRSLAAGGRIGLTYYFSDNRTLLQAGAELISLLLKDNEEGPLQDYKINSKA